MNTQTNIVPFEATHPGVLIKDELEARPDLKQKDLAKELGVKASFLNEIIKGKRPITADIAVLLEKILAIPADYWMRFQTQYEIDKARIKAKNVARLKNIETWTVIKEYVPISYFKRLRYINDNLDRDIQTIKEIYSVTDIDELVSTYSKFKLAMDGLGEELKVDERNLFAWSSLAQYEAKNQLVDTFNYENLNQLYKILKDIFIEKDHIIQKVKLTLNQYGIKLVLIQKLEKTPVEGFSFWSESNPAIAITAKNYRDDNFALILMHAMAHIDLHLKDNKGKSFLDLKCKDKTDEYKKEAELFARRKLNN